jgi:hypothetical protein
MNEDLIEKVGYFHGCKILCLRMLDGLHMYNFAFNCIYTWLNANFHIITVI